MKVAEQGVTRWGRHESLHDGQEIFILIHRLKLGPHINYFTPMRLGTSQSSSGEPDVSWGSSGLTDMM